VQQRPAGPGFPPADLIMGDFNIPRGSASLRQAAQGYPHAHTQAGHGHAGTYPRHRPLVHIDHMFIGPALRARRYQVVDGGVGSHRMQVLDVALDRDHRQR
jgi:endonuclease/exonuclease/phosphatase family metal-dependent hydrolase